LSKACGGADEENCEDDSGARDVRECVGKFHVLVPGQRNLFKRLNLSEKTVKLIFFHVKGKMTDVRPS
jgi:hypothetical protein